MGAKTWMLVYADGDARERLATAHTLDREATAALAAALFPRDRLQRQPDGSLTWTCPRNRELYVGSFPGVDVIAAKEFALDRPSTLAPRFIAHAGARTLYLHAMHSVVDWLAFAVWRESQLVRSLSVAPDDGVIEDRGERLPFELPYWAGAHPALDGADDAEDAYPLPFHPLELGEAALRAFFGYQLEGDGDQPMVDSDAVPLARYTRRRGWFRLW